jgi:hypothetical protein
MVILCMGTAPIHSHFFHPWLGQAQSDSANTHVKPSPSVSPRGDVPHLMTFTLLANISPISTADLGCFFKHTQGIRPLWALSRWATVQTHTSAVRGAVRCERKYILHTKGDKKDASMRCDWVILTSLHTSSGPTFRPVTGFWQGNVTQHDKTIKFLTDLSLFWQVDRSSYGLRGVPLQLHTYTITHTVLKSENCCVMFTCFCLQLARMLKSRRCF